MLYGNGTIVYLILIQMLSICDIDLFSDWSLDDKRGLFSFQVAFSTTGKVGVETIAPAKSESPEQKTNNVAGGDSDEEEIDIDAI